MKVCYQHFPIVTVVYEDGAVLEIKHYLGENHVKRIRLLEGCRAFKINDQAKKDDVWIQGNSIENVSLSCKELRELLVIFLRRFDQLIIESQAYGHQNVLRWNLRFQQKG